MFGDPAAVVQQLKRSFVQCCSTVEHIVVQSRPGGKEQREQLVRSVADHVFILLHQ